MVSWFFIIPGLAALQQTEWTEKKKSQTGSWGLTHCLSAFLCYLSACLTKFQNAFVYLSGINNEGIDILRLVNVFNYL